MRTAAFFSAAISIVENNTAEAVQSNTKIHAADTECGQNFGPDNWEIGSAI
jgi:hypothetical protein